MANLLPMGTPSTVLVKVQEEQFGPPQKKTIVPINVQYFLNDGWVLVAVDRSTNHVTNFKLDVLEPLIIWELYK